MAKDKYDFIQDLLENKKLSTAQLGRVLHLTSEEIKKDISGGSKLEDRVRKLEDAIQNMENPDTLNDRKNDSNADGQNLGRIGGIKYISPKDLYTFLKDYNTDQILKTTCHEIDGNELINILEFCNTEIYDFKVHRKKVQDRFRELAKRHFVSNKIKTLISVYLTGENFDGKKGHWTDDSIEMNWNSAALEKWCEDNPGKIPHPNEGLFNNQGKIEYKIRPSISTRIMGQRKMTSFSDLVIHFKYLFHLRSDNSLFSIIEKINKEKLEWKDQIDFELDRTHFPENIEFFTNIEKLTQAYRILIELIREVVLKNGMEKPIVRLSLKEVENGLEFSIHHKNSFYRKSVDNTIEKDGATQFSLIKNQINGLCDFYLRADFGNQRYAEINIWEGQSGSNKPNELIEHPLALFEGVEYILKFKK